MSNTQAMDYDLVNEKKAIDDTKAGIKGLVDAGIVEIPKIFIRPPHELADEELNICKSNLQVPVVDLSGIQDQDQHKKIVDQLREASEKWGLFHLINHGIPSSVLEGMIDGSRKFHEQDVELKKEYFSYDVTKRVRYNCNLRQYNSKSASWRDSLTISGPGHIEPEEIPAVCRKTSLEYIDHAIKLGDILCGLLSEALGLNTDHLKSMEFAKEQTFVCQYYPTCPQPELTLGTQKHTDPASFTLLLQDQTGGLQVLHNNQWFHVEPIGGSLVVNIGDHLQILSNDKFVSATHRVLANKVGPRMSVGCFFVGSSRIYGPIKELISEENPPVYKEFEPNDYRNKYLSRPYNKSGLDFFRL